HVGANAFRHGQQLLAIRDLLRNFRGHDHLLVRIDGDLSVVGLDKTFSGVVAHHARVGIDEIVLARRTSSIAPGAAAAFLFLVPLLGIAGIAGLFLFTRSPWLAYCLVLGGCPQLLLSFFFQFGFGLLNAFQPTMRVRKFLRQRIPNVSRTELLVLALISLFRFDQQMRDGCFPILLAFA